MNPVAPAPENPLHREDKPWDFPDPENAKKQDSPTTVWRNDHKDPRDRKAHALFKVVSEDRVIARVRAETRRLMGSPNARPNDHTVPGPAPSAGPFPRPLLGQLGGLPGHHAPRPALVGVNVGEPDPE